MIETEYQPPITEPAVNEEDTRTSAPAGEEATKEVVVDNRGPIQRLTDSYTSYVQRIGLEPNNPDLKIFEASLIKKISLEPIGYQQASSTQVDMALTEKGLLSVAKDSIKLTEAQRRQIVSWMLNTMHSNEQAGYYISKMFEARRY